MQKILFPFLLCVLFCCENQTHKIQENASFDENKQKKTTNKVLKHQTGDIIFQISASGQGKAIQLATNSLYTHCGIIYEVNNNFFVFEAIQPVVLTPLDEWISRGEKKHFVTKRLKNADKILTKEALKNMEKFGNEFKGKNYDIWFGWSDEHIYCSELVWKIYKKALNLEVGKCQLFKDFDLSSKEVQKIIKARYGKKIPLEEVVISPAAILKSPYLETIFGKEL